MGTDIHQEEQGEERGARLQQSPPLTKKQLKRVKKAQYLAEKKKLKKEKKKQERQAKKDDIRERKGPLSPEELDRVRQATFEKVQRRRAQREAQRDRAKKSLEEGQRIIIDLDYESYMHEGEIKSIIQQIAFSYGMNKNATHPCHLILTSVAGGIRQAFDRQFKDNGSWFVTQTDASYLDYCSEEKDKIVYLTAEAEHEVGEIDKDCIYVVGGIVDKNRHKGLCYKRAVENGIRTARLPIGEYVKLRRSQVMCTNHVIEMLVRWQDTRDWKQAFESVVPERKKQ